MRRNRIIIGIFIVLIASGIWFFVERFQRSGNKEELSIRERPADAIFLLSFTNTDGNAVSMSEFKGKNLILNAWATWCPYCTEELPGFRDVAGEYGNAITVIAVNRGESQETAHSYITRKNLSGSILYVTDPDDTLYKAIGGFSMPETIFIDTNGIIRFHKRGPMTQEELCRRTQDIFGI